MAGVKGRNPFLGGILGMGATPRGKAGVSRPCKLAVLVVCSFMVITLFALQNVYVWCETPGRQQQQQGEQAAGGGNASSAASFNNSSAAAVPPPSVGPFKAMLCLASQRYVGVNSASSDFLYSLTSAMKNSNGCRTGLGGALGLPAAADQDDDGGDDDSAAAYADERSWKSQWERRNLSVTPAEPEALADGQVVSQLEMVDPWRLTGGGGPAGCARRPGPVMLSVDGAGTGGGGDRMVPCPVLWECSERQAGKVRAMCWDTRFFDALTPMSLPTEGPGFRTPLLGDATVSNYGEYVGAVMWLAHVYTNSHAQLFDSRTHFLRGGCWDRRDDPLFVASGGATKPTTAVLRLPLAINLCSNHANNQFHGLVELMGRAALLVPTIRALALAPPVPATGGAAAAARILVTARDYPHVSGFLDMLGFPGGLDAPALAPAVQVLQPHDLAWADAMAVAHSPGCGHASGSVWRHIRRRHFRVPLSPLETGTADEWYLVLEERKGTRALAQHDALQGALQAALGGPARVKLFSDRVDWSLPATRALFARAAVLVAPHGAGLSNMVFMPQRASVVEVRPANFSNRCYHALADALGFRYYRFDSPGDKSSVLDVDVPRVVRLVVDIVRAGGRPVHFYDEVAWRRRRLRRRR